MECRWSTFYNSFGFLTEVHILVLFPLSKNPHTDWKTKQNKTNPKTKILTKEKKLTTAWYVKFIFRAIALFFLVIGVQHILQLWDAFAPS